MIKHIIFKLTGAKAEIDKLRYFIEEYDNEIKRLKSEMECRNDIPSIFFKKEIKDELKFTKEDLKTIKESYNNAKPFLLAFERLLFSEIRRLTALITNIYTEDKDRQNALYQLDCYKYILSQMGRAKHFKEKEKEDKDY